VVKRPRITTERNIAMALDQSALLEVLDALRMPMPLIGLRRPPK
jgi:hypothetical protein